MTTLTTDAILDRLKLCHAEITGIETALRLPPTKAFLPTALPAVYALPMGMPQRTPGNRQAGMYVVTRNFRVRVFVARMTVASLDTGDEGAKLVADVIPYLDRFVDYFATHPRLHLGPNSAASTTAELAGLDSDVFWQDGGPEQITGPDGETYAGINGVLTVSARRYTQKLS